MVHAVFPTTFVIMGDSLMYVVLPTAAIEFGLGETLGLATSFWIGLALSINRFIRLASNAFAAAVYYRFGVRWPYVIAVALGALTTLAYGLGSGLVVLLVSRALWGVSYSYLRLGAYLTAFNVGTSQMRGRLIGFFTAGSRGGSLIAVTAGAALFEQTSRGIAFSVLAGLGILGLIMALRVPNLKPRRSRNTGAGSLRRMGIWDLAVSKLPDHARRIRLPLLSISLMSFAIAFAANGLAIATPVDVRGRTGRKGQPGFWRIDCSGDPGGPPYRCPLVCRPRARPTARTSFGPSGEAALHRLRHGGSRCGAGSNCHLRHD